MHFQPGSGHHVAPDHAKKIKMLTGTVAESAA
jgi:hypothetical protein